MITIFAMSLALGGMLGLHGVLALSRPTPLEIICARIAVLELPDSAAAQAAAEAQYQVWRELVGRQ